MASKSWSTTSAVQCPSRRRHLGRHTDFIIYAVEDCRSHRDKSSKRNSEEGLERASKKSRTSQSPCEGCSHTPSGPSSSANAASSASTYTCTETQSLSGRSSVAVSESKEGPRKRRRGTRTHTFRGSSSSTVDAGTSTPASVSIRAEDKERKSRKRKSEETEGPRKRSRKTPSPSEAPSHQISAEASSSDEAGSSLSLSTDSHDSRAAFQAKYEEEELLGEGGFGCVYAGHRKDNNLPVAIKHIPQFGIEHTKLYLDGKNRMVPTEVVLLLKLQPRAAETSAVVTLLDWYNLDQELILVLERPVPCLDLTDYINFRQSPLQEHEAKTITKQLVDAIIEVHSRGVFHRDIKMDNILIETSSDVPRVRLIDFGCGTLLSHEKYTTEQGTYEYTTPEWFLRQWYRAESTTVWQLGVVLFGMLHKRLPFRSSSEIVHVDPELSGDLSFDCQRFLQSCLLKSPEARPSLERLKRHPWLM